MAGRATRHELAGLVGENAWARQAGRVRVAVLLLGGLSNFTDCDAYKMVDTLDQPWLCQSAAFFYPLQAVNFFLPRGLPRLKA